MHMTHISNAFNLRMIQRGTFQQVTIRVSCATNTIHKQHANHYVKYTTHACPTSALFHKL